MALGKGGQDASRGRLLGGVEEDRRIVVPRRKVTDHPPGRPIDVEIIETRVGEDFPGCASRKRHFIPAPRTRLRVEFVVQDRGAVLAQGGDADVALVLQTGGYDGVLGVADRPGAATGGYVEGSRDLAVLIDQPFPAMVLGRFRCNHARVVDGVNLVETHRAAIEVVMAVAVGGQLHAAKKSVPLPGDLPEPISPEDRAQHGVIARKDDLRLRIIHPDNASNPQFQLPGAGVHLGQLLRLARFQQHRIVAEPRDPANLLGSQE